MRINISTKLIALVVSFLVTATALFAFKSSELFESVLVQREKDGNLTMATARLKEVDGIMSSLKQKSYLMGNLILASMQKKETTQAEGQIDEITTNLNSDPNLLSVELYEKTDNGFKLVSRKSKDKVLLENKKETTYIEKVRTEIPFPINSLFQKSNSLASSEIMNTTLQGGIPLITFGMPVKEDAEGTGYTHVVVADFLLGALQKPFSERSERIMYLVDKAGMLLAHADESKVIARQIPKHIPIVEKALASDSKFPQQTQFVDPETEHTMLGAYAKSAYGVTVISQIDKERILAPAKEVKREAVYIAGTVISVALFLIFMFSLTLTGPIETLAELIQYVSRGNLEITAKDKIKSKDEVRDLAVAFDEMVVGLRERAKAYAVMNQALGANVIETLMNMKESELGGMRKPVSVLFSDLRDFTKFSEGHSPEEVVEMLNEYFDVMVKIISKHGGWLDKFIGDAIMAVWGVPYTGDHDDENAVRAALEMRTALDELNKIRLARGQTPAKIGIGLHTGDAIVGKIGATERANLTVIGDTVNQASRIEASTKAFGADILLSSEIAEKVKTKFVLEYGGAAEVKGKAEALKLFKLRGYYLENGESVLIKTAYSDYEAGDADKVKVAS